MKQQHSRQQLNAAAVLWLEHHIECLRASYQKIRSAPLAFSFTVLMIAIALAIPIGLSVIFSSVTQLTQHWDGDKQITLFLNDNVSLQQAQTLANKITEHDSVLSAQVLNKQQALEDFNQQMGMDALSSDLADNPLPHLIIVQPNTTSTDAALTDIDSLQTLQTEFSSNKQVQLVQFDLLWFQRLQAMLAVIKRIQWVSASLLLFAIALIIANVIRWEVTARHSEIEIIKLVGASDRYVRRPFLYSGLWLGLVGAIIALVIIACSAWVIQRAAARLLDLFGSDFVLAAVSFDQSFFVIVGVSLLGVIASWIAVTHKLKQYT